MNNIRTPIYPLALWLALAFLLSACSSQHATTPAPVVKPNLSEAPKKPAAPETALPLKKPPVQPIDPVQESNVPPTTPSKPPIDYANNGETTLPNLQQDKITSAQKSLRKVVILLPDRPSLAEVNRDIEKGIRAAHQQQAHNPHLQLVFLYDALNGEALMSKANAFNPDWIIGPLTKTDIQSVQNLTSDRHIFLNRLDTPTPALQIGLPAEDEVDQLLAQFKPQKGALLLIASNDASEQRLVSYLNNQAKALGFNLTLLSVEKQNPSIRDWLMREGGVQASQERIGRISQLVKGDLTDTTPQARQDIQAVIFLGNAKQLRSIMPSLAYYRISWPVYATSRLLPSKTTDAFNEPELNGVKVLVPPYLMNQQAPTSLFEALGWDSYLLLGNPQAHMAPKQTGKLIQQNNQLYRLLNWHIIKDGQLNAIQSP